MFVEAAGTVARSEKVQYVVHVVVAAHNGSIDPRPLNYVELEGSYQKTPALSVEDETDVLLPCEPRRKCPSASSFP